MILRLSDSMPWPASDFGLHVACEQIHTSHQMRPLHTVFSLPLSDKLTKPLALSIFDVGVILSTKQVFGWLLGDRHQVECQSGEKGYRLLIADLAEFVISRNGEAIVQKAGIESLTDLQWLEIIFGPPMCLTLALKGKYTLHASATIVDGKAVVFLGESGDGKSTLAAYLARQAPDRWRLAADDILPLAADPDHPQVLPHFPQLKLPLDAQPALSLPERLPLLAVYVIDPLPGGNESTVHRMSYRDAAAALIQHTICGSLFDDHLLRKHMTFCTRLATKVPVVRLGYPHSRDALPQVTEVLQQDLATISSREG